MGESQLAKIAIVTEADYVIVSSYNADLEKIYTNYGEIQNKGFEFTVNYHKQVNKDFGFNVSLNGSTLSNKVKKMGDPIYSTCSANGAGTLDGSNVQAVGDANGFLWGDHSICMEGEAVGSFYGYLTDGIIKNQQELDAYVKSITFIAEDGTPTYGDNVGSGASIGDYRFKDINGDNRIDNNGCDCSKFIWNTSEVRRNTRNL